MPTSNTNPQQSAATDSPLGAPAGNEPYLTKRAQNWANPENTGSMSDTNIDADAGAEAEDLEQTDAPIGNIASGSETKPEPKPANHP